ncbi:MAG: hypothetical protein V3U64_00885 [Cocleimonas sp.]
MTNNFFLYRTQPKSTFRFRSRATLWLASLCLLSGVLFNTAHAQGVSAGTDISNIVVVNYTINGITQQPIESSPTGNAASGIGNGQGTAFTVDRKVDLSVNTLGDASVALGVSQAELLFSLINDGNDSQEFSLSPSSTLNTDDFNTANCTTTVMSVSPGAPLAGVVIPTSGNIKLKADQQAGISVKCDIPLNNGGSPIIIGQASLLSLTANAIKNSDGSPTIQTITTDIAMAVDTIFADGMGTDDSDRDAAHSSRARYIASNSTNPPPTLAINKSIVNVKDTNGGNSAVAGSEVTYKIKVTTSGVGMINNVVITDVTPAEMHYKPTTITVDGAILTDINTDLDKADYGLTTANTATIDLGNITAGHQHEILLTYVIN